MITVTFLDHLITSISVNVNAVYDYHPYLSLAPVKLPSLTGSTFRAIHLSPHTTLHPCGMNGMKNGRFIYTNPDVRVRRTNGARRCVKCNNTKSPTWRLSPTGDTLCNK
jgi:hypothetical protein